MIKSTLIAIAASLVVFIISWKCGMIMTRKLGTHAAFDSMVQLKQLHYIIDIFKNDNNSLPEAEELNSIICEQHQRSPQENISPDSSDKNYALFLISQKISEDRYLRLWGAPPIYIKDKRLPEGYGFYLAGEDGISESMGRDADDVNSWDRKSFRFYAVRMREQEELPIKYISIIPALFTFIYIITRKKKTFRSRRDSKA